MKDGCNMILREYKKESDSKFGNTKIFIRSPRTILELEEERTKRLPQIALKMQKVRDQLNLKLYFIKSTSEVNSIDVVDPCKNVKESIKLLSLLMV